MSDLDLSTRLGTPSDLPTRGVGCPHGPGARVVGPGGPGDHALAWGFLAGYQTVLFSAGDRSINLPDQLQITRRRDSGADNTYLQCYSQRGSGTAPPWDAVVPASSPWLGPAWACRRHRDCRSAGLVVGRGRTKSGGRPHSLRAVRHGPLVLEIATSSDNSTAARPTGARHCCVRHSWSEEGDRVVIGPRSTRLGIETTLPPSSAEYQTPSAQTQPEPGLRERPSYRPETSPEWRAGATAAPWIGQA